MVGGSNIALPSLGWTITTNTDNNTFTFNGSSTDQFKYVEFVNHLYNGNNDGVCRDEEFDYCQRNCNNSCSGVEDCLKGCTILTPSDHSSFSKCIEYKKKKKKTYLFFIPLKNKIK